MNAKEAQKSNKPSMMKQLSHQPRYEVAWSEMNPLLGNLVGIHVLAEPQVLEIFRTCEPRMHEA